MDQTPPSMTIIAMVSLALHAALAWSLNGSAHAIAPVQREPVRITVREMAKPPVPEPVLEAPEPAPIVSKPVAQQRAPRKEKKATAEPTSAPRSLEPAQRNPEPAPALDFTGVTLTSANGSFAQIAGNGDAMSGPLGRTHSSHGTNPHGDGKGAAQGAELVALGSLSRAPRAPALDDALAANYPKNAHDLGLSGEAVVRARILPSGEVAATHVLVASAPEFGKACQRTLAGSRWSAPLDAAGHPVATELSYKCVFEVTH